MMSARSLWLVAGYLALGLGACSTTGNSSSSKAPTVTSPYAEGSSAATDACSKMAALRQAATDQTLAASDMPAKLQGVVSSATDAANVNPTYADLMLQAGRARAAVLNNEVAAFQTALHAFSTDCGPVSDYDKSVGIQP
ncbi:MAG: hypothetical protein ACYDH6_08710 [Acidimicrobiales bacterium]